jgi:IS30 family transposase
MMTWNSANWFNNTSVRKDFMSTLFMTAPPTGVSESLSKSYDLVTVQVYFCDPQSPGQRGTNENTNLLLRQYFPRGTDLSGYSQEQLDQVSLLLNQRPRKTLGFQTPADKLQASVASTA